MNKSTNIMLVGVGGQGTILASDILALLGMKLGYDVKKAEVHGMSQRGGSVISHVRWGSEVFSPVIARGEADVLVAFEKMEAVRYIENLRSSGMALINDHTISPITVSAGGAEYPDDQSIHSALAQVTEKAYWVKGIEIAEGLGSARTANVVILGALSGLLDLEPGVWLDVIEKSVPSKFMELNRKAFDAGRKALQ